MPGDVADVRALVIARHPWYIRDVHDFKRFLTIALGSAYELETQVLLVRDLSLATEEAATKHLLELSEIQRMLHGLRGSVRA